MGLTERSFLERMELMGLTESRTVTNADRIRSMSDEELAEKLSEIETGVKTYGEGVFSYWLDWLRQEAQP